VFHRARAARARTGPCSASIAAASTSSRFAEWWLSGRRRRCS
jgi:hypothetical protein